jgi:hypothetical protein
MVAACAARTRAASLVLLMVALSTASRMAGAGGASKRAAPRGLNCKQAARSTARRMAAVGAARPEAGCTKSARGDTRPCKAHGGGKRCQHEGCSKSAVQDGTDHCKTHGGGAGGASTWAAPSQLLQLAHSTASRMAEAGDASTWTAPRQLRQAARCTGQALGGGRRCQHEGCTKAVVRSTWTYTAVVGRRHQDFRAEPISR